jgi:hypothetical protein
LKIDYHISEFLYDHDCVIVPAFGGLLASYHHSQIHPSQHLFTPPSRKIAFNVFLKQNDGMLTNYISTEEKISYSEALREIEQQVNFWKNDLEQGKRLVIERIGIFYFNSEKNLQFEPVKNINYLRDAFGLSAVQYLPVDRESYHRQVEKQVKKIVSLRSSARLNKIPVKLSKKTKAKIAGTLIISSALLWFSLNLFLINPHRLDLTTLNPFSSATENVQPLKEKSKAENSIQSLSTKPAEVSNEVPANSSETGTEKKEITDTQEKDQVQPSLSVTEEEKYFIIGGAFQFPENAEAFAKTLQSEGFTEARVLHSPKRLQMVCFKGFTTKEEAQREMDSLKAMNKSGWIFTL